MAAAKGYFPRANHRFLPINQAMTFTTDSIIFELDESDVWKSAATRSQSPEIRKTASRILRKSSSAAAAVNGRVGGPASLPVNVPDWSKILKNEYRENRQRDSDDEYDVDDGEDNGSWIPPHEFLARQMARAGIACFSVHEGVGRTLKGRDLSRVRDAIWQKAGFED